MDEAAWKRITKRLGIQEELNEVLLEETACLFRAVKILSKKTESSIGADPMCAAMTLPGMGPVVLPPGLSEELGNGVHKFAVDQLNDLDLAEYNRRTQLIFVARQMRMEREARRARAKLGVKAPPGGAGGATPGGF